LVLVKRSGESLVFLRFDRHYSQTRSLLDGVVVSVLATGPKVHGFKPGRGNGFIRAIKIRSTPYFVCEVKQEVPCKIFGILKIP
jgi:hypothetical protein